MIKTKPRHTGTHLSLDDRIYIEAAIERHLTFKEMSVFLEKDPTTISKEITATGYKVWINCIDGVNCITEKGVIGKNDSYYGEYNRTYLPANSESDMNAIYYQLDYLLRLANEIR